MTGAMVRLPFNTGTHLQNTHTHTDNEAQVFLGLAYTLAVCHVSVSRANSRQHTHKTKHKSTQSYSLKAGLEPAQALMRVFKSHTQWHHYPPGLECQNERRETVRVYVQVCVCMQIYPNC